MNENQIKQTFINKNIVQNEEMLDQYINFCFNNNQEKHTKFKTELHHVLPSSLFNQYTSLKEHKWNGVYLNFKDHLMAHYLIWKATSDSKMGTALYFMINQTNLNDVSLDFIVNFQEEYQELKENNAKYHSETMNFVHPDGETEAQKRTKKALLTRKNTILENGLTIDQDNARRSALTKKNTILENGLSIKENSVIKYSKTVTTTILENGLTIAQDVGLRSASTRKNTKLENGLTIAQDVGLRSGNTKMNTILENNLSIAQNAAVLGAKTMRETVLENGLSIRQIATVKGLETKSSKEWLNSTGKRLKEERKQRAREKGRRFNVYNYRDELIEENIASADLREISQVYIKRPGKRLGLTTNSKVQLNQSGNLHLIGSYSLEIIK